MRETKLFDFGLAQDDFRERRLVFVDVMNDEETEAQAPKAEVQSNDVEISDADRKMVQEGLKENEFGRQLFGVDPENISFSSLAAAELLTEEVRSQVHKIEGSTDKLLDLAITEELRKHLEIIAKIRKRYDLSDEKGQAKFEKDVNKLAGKLDSETGIQSEIDRLEKIKTSSMFAKRRPQIESEITELENLKEKRKKVDADKRYSFAFAEGTSADYLKSSFDGFGSAVESDFQSNGKFEEYEPLYNLLSPTERKNWKEKGSEGETFRVLLSQVSQSPDYLALLNGGEVRGVTTLGIETILQGDQTEEALKKLRDEKKILKDQLRGKIEINVINELGTNQGRIFPNGGLSLALTTQKNIVEKLKTNLKSIEKKLKEQANQEAVNLEEKWRTEQAAEEKCQREFDTAKETQKQYKAPSGKLVKSEEAELAKSEQEKNANAVKKAGDSLSDKQSDKLAVQDKMRALATKHKVEFKPESTDFLRYFSENFSAETTEISATDKNKLKQARERYESANGNLAIMQEHKDELTGKLNQIDKDIIKKQIETKTNPIEKKRTFHGPKEILTALEIELAKVSICNKEGLKKTSDLEKPENAALKEEAERIGKCSCRIKVEEMSNGAVKKANARRLEKYIADNPTMQEKAMGNIINFGKKAIQKPTEWLKNDMKQMGTGFSNALSGGADRYADAWNEPLFGKKSA